MLGNMWNIKDKPKPCLNSQFAQLLPSAHIADDDLLHPASLQINMILIF